MQPQVSMRTWARFAVSACLLAGCAFAPATVMAQVPGPQGPGVPPGWVWQGVWQDGRWNGQWIPGGPPGMPQAMPQVMPQVMPMPPGGYAPPPPPPIGDPHMMERCRDWYQDGDTDEHHRKHRHDRDCEAFVRDHPEWPQGYGPAPQAYSYGVAPVMAPPGYMMVPVIQGPQPPCVETRTTTTEYVTESGHAGHRVIRAKPHRKEKRVYTGS